MKNYEVGNATIEAGVRTKLISLTKSYLLTPVIKITPLVNAIVYISEVTNSYFIVNTNSDEEVNIYYVVIESEQIMPRDFLSDQIRTKKIIGAGDSSSPKLMIYSDDDALDNVGGIDPGLLSNVGNDVFLFVSGAIDGKENNTQNSVTLFGGDVVVSGTLYTENKVVELGAVQTSIWEIDPNDSNNLRTSNVLDGDSGLFALDFNLTLDSSNCIELVKYTTTNRPDAKDAFFELDSNGNITSKA